MAIVPSTRYPTQTNAPTAGYPQGSARNITVPGDGTGTPWEADLVNDWFGFFQSLLDAAGITPSGTPDEVGASDYFNAIGTLVGTGVYSTDGGTTFRDNVDRWSDFVNVKDHGATGDGVTDDTAAIQSAANTSKPLYFPQGTYKIDGTITCSSSLFAHGQATILANTGTIDTPVFSYTSINNFKVIGFFLRLESRRYMFQVTSCSKFQFLENILTRNLPAFPENKPTFVSITASSQGVISENNVTLDTDFHNMITISNSQDILISGNFFNGNGFANKAIRVLTVGSDRIAITKNIFVSTQAFNIDNSPLVTIQDNDLSASLALSISSVAVNAASLIKNNNVGSNYNVSSGTTTFALSVPADRIFLQGASTSMENINLAGFSLVPEGYELTVVADTVATTVVHGTGNILLSNDANRLLRVGEAIKLVRVGSSWREVGGDNYYTAGFLEVGQGRPSAGDAYVDLHGTTGTDFDARFIRGSGANGNLLFLNKGTGVTEITNVAGVGAGQGTRVQGYRSGAVGAGFVGESFQVNSIGVFGTPTLYGLAVAQSLTAGIWILSGTFDFENVSGAARQVWATINSSANDNNACLYFNPQFPIGQRLISDIGTITISLSATQPWGIYVKADAAGVNANNAFIYFKATRIA